MALPMPTAVQLAAFDLVLSRIQTALACSTEEALSRVTATLGSNPSLGDLQEAYRRVLREGAL